MILLDTSAWIDFFRGREPCASAVDDALATGEAAICGPIITELRRGLRTSERQRVLPLLDGCNMLTQPPGLWEHAGDLGAQLGTRGITVKTLDLLIATYALAHALPLLTSDKDFLLMANNGVGLELLPYS